MMRRLFVAATVIICWLDWSAPSSADNWPAWRGPTGDGVCREKSVPLTWSRDENVVWRAELPGPGNSTPIIWENRVFVTCASDDGRRRALICFDRDSGDRLWEQAVTYDKKEVTHKTNPQCSPSPTTDGRLVFAWHGSAGLYAYDLEGNKKWERDLGTFEHIWGYAASPLIFEDLLILNCGPGTNAYVVALNKQTGQQVWRRDVPSMVSEKVEEYRGSWSTPVVHGAGKAARLFLSLPEVLLAVDPRTGDDIWSCSGMTKLVYTSPLVNDRYVVAMCGYHGNALAVRRGGRGDVTDTHRLWLHSERKQIPQRVGSGVIVGDQIYILNEPGIAWCLDIQTGEKRWEKRLGGGRSWTSMVHAGDRLYVLNEAGTTFVLAVDPDQCRVLAENKLGETTRGSLAVSNGRVFVRTYQHLYCLGGSDQSE